MARIVNNRFRFVPSPAKSGAFCDVYKAFDLDSEPLRDVAVKVLRLGQHPDFVANTTIAREYESLAKLKHPNIVRLFDAGIDEQTGERFLVLEWVDSTLDVYLDGSMAEPDEFIGGVGVKLAEAMAFAHENGVAHRDLKPANVLLASDGEVKVADFGISRIINLIEVRPEGVAPTVANFGSPPFAPPEIDASPYARDVWGLGATLLAGLVRKQLANFEDIRHAKDELDVPSDLAAIILSCLSDDPKDRPADCRVVNAELQHYWRKRKVRTTERVNVFVGVSRSAANWLGTEDLDVAARMVAEDLGDGAVIIATASRQGQDSHYLVLGDTNVYRVARDNSRNPLPRLSVIDAKTPSGFEADRIRDQGLAVDFANFRPGVPADRVAASDGLDRLLEEADRHEVEVVASRRENEAHRLLDQWRMQIDARNKIEADKENPIDYVAVERQERRAIFTVRGSSDNIDVGEVRRANSTTSTKSFVRGEVEEVAGNRVTLYLEEGVEGIPASGKLVVDTQPSRSKIRREEHALDVVARSPGTAARSDLPELIFNPGSASLPSPASVDEWVSERLDESKKAAVSAALGAQDLFVVQGPPGTGKTTFIAELVAQELRRNDRAKILVTSQTNVALDTALDRIDQAHSSGSRPGIIRLADPKFAKVGPEAERFLVEGQLAAWRERTVVKSKEFLDAWVENLGLSVETVRESLFLHELAGFLSGLASAEADLLRLEGYYDGSIDSAEDEMSGDELDETLQATYDLISEMEERLLRFQRTNPRLSKKYQNSIDSRDAKSVRTQADALLGGSTAATELRSLVELQADWLLRLGKGTGFVAALAQDSSVIGATCIGLAAVQELSESQFDLCVIDECSKATATETLVPMIRAKRWVLVGDEKQLPAMVEDALKERNILEEFALDQVELETTLFSRLAQGLPNQCSAMLNEQHRMVRPIGELISSCFYGGELLSVGADSVPPVPGVLPKPVTWHDTSRMDGRFENKPGENQFSYANQTEARVAVDLLRRLASHCSDPADSKSVLVIAPYSAQVQEIRRRVRQVGALEGLRVEVATVDAVQGREADFVIFSITRSNPRGEAGFLRLDARANVALSRARSGLVILGDMGFCRVADSPFRDVAHFVSSHPDSCARVGVDR